VKSSRVRWLAIAVLVGVLFGDGSDLDASGQGSVTHRLRVSRAVGTGDLTAAQADAIITKMSRILQENDGPGDVPCDVGFVRDGVIDSFGRIPSVILSENQFIAVADRAADRSDVVVVERINWCGIPKSNVAGCTWLGVSVVQRSARDSGVVWAHEFGHRKGLGHRSVRKALMNGSVSSASRRVSQEECDAYRMP